MTERPADIGETRAAPPASERSGPLRTGWVVFALLAVLTIVEFIIAVTIDANLPIMIVIALMKAGLIMHYFMHLLRIWRGGEEA